MGKDETTTNDICCTIVGILFNVVSRTSILLVSVMSVDRFVGLFYPAFYKRNIKNAVVLVNEVYARISVPISAIYYPLLN